MKSPAAAIVAVAILWAGVIIAVASTVHGTTYATSVLVYIAGGAAITLIIVATSLRRMRAVNR